MAMTIYLTINGKSQGAIEGDCTQKGREKQIIGYALDHTMVIPQDTHTGLPTGQRVHKPFVITTDVGKATPKIFQACSTGERLDVTADFYRINDKGLEEKYYTVKLTNAIVVNAKEWFPETFINDHAGYKHMLTAALAYEKIVWTYVPDGIEAEDDWQTPKSSG